MFTTLSKAQPPGLHSPFLLQVSTSILANLDDEAFGVAELAVAMHISRTQLFRRIKALTGRNVARYIHLVRIQEVKRLLLCTELSVAEVAWRTGFADPSYLRRVFLRETGETLARYRRECGCR